MNYAVQYNALQRRYESLLADMQQVLGLLRRNRHRAALALLDSVLGGESGDEDESDESQAEAQPEADAPAPIVQPTVAFVGRSFRLGASEPVGDAAVGGAAGAAADGASDGAAGDAADDASDSDDEAHCCRCGDRTNLHVFARSGVWRDVESAAERTYCVDCLNN